MSHKISVAGNFGNAQSLKDTLTEKGVSFSEKTEGGETFLTFADSRYNRYGNPLRINLTNPKSSSMDADIGREVGEWYRDSMVRHIRSQALMAGHSLVSETRSGSNVVLRLAVG